MSEFDLNPVLLKTEHDYLAPDGSEIRLLARGANGSLCHCTLPEGAISSAVSHKTIEEQWYFVEGHGEVWRGGLCDNEPVAVGPGTSLIVPVLTPFQFRNTGAGPLRFIITSTPPWPGPQEARPEPGYW
jgi:mannose-6-phosphate isomerase-like protein (cupin superfamily)